jgi:hypothetical protein
VERVHENAMYNKTVIEFGFCDISRIIKVSASVIKVHFLRNTCLTEKSVSILADDYGIDYCKRTITQICNANCQVERQAWFPFGPRNGRNDWVTIFLSS